MLASIKSDDEKLIQAAKEADNILNPALTFDKAWNAYLKNQERPQESGERNLKNYASYFQKFKTWIEENKPGMIRLKDVTKETASEYALFLKHSNLSAGTFNKHRTFLKTLFHFLRDAAKIEQNPFESIKRLADTPNTRRELSIEEIRTILERASGNLQLLLGLRIFTGLRLGDCCTLQWHEINFENRTIKRIPNKTAKSKKPVIVGIPEILYQKLNETPLSQRKGYQYKKWGDNLDIVTYVQQNSAYYKGCVYSIIREWHKQGMPRTNEYRHDFRDWCRCIDAIVKMAWPDAIPLMDNHREAQARRSNYVLTWLRQICVAVDQGCKLDGDFSASDILELCEVNNIDLLNSKTDDEKSRQIYTGKLLSKCFKGDTEISIDEYHVSRKEKSVYRQEKMDTYSVKIYVFSKNAKTAVQPQETVSLAIPSSTLPIKENGPFSRNSTAAVGYCEVLWGTVGYCGVLWGKCDIGSL